MHRQLANGTHAHLEPNCFFPNSLMRGSFVRGINLPFGRLFPCSSQVAYALRTRAPVASKVLLLPAAPRLACVRPVASVHPEPGSNSSLYDFFVLYLLGPALTVTLVTVATTCSLTCDVRHFQYVNVLFVAFTWLRLERQPRCKVKWFFLILQEVFCFFLRSGERGGSLSESECKGRGLVFYFQILGEVFFDWGGGGMG